MNTIIKNIGLSIISIRRFNNEQVKKFAAGVKNKKILELGSGKKKNDEYYYSTRRFFDKSNNFTQSDIKKEYGHKLVDVTTMRFNKEFDIILCLNVLEHVINTKKAVDNIYKALKKGGVALFVIPFAFPLHDEPGDYYRFTKYGLKEILKKFKDVKIKEYGFRLMPLAYYAEARK
ncbi:Ubiquinone biosynthesis O-methyltransferase [Candidatus Tiddalikarchaeum anstoanum]|nr:Ubiquinone biosynthesis O-methyltransferase [Candidatus Tiddalikarchaeum anstoanum]